MTAQWKPSDRFTATSGTQVTPALADRIIGSILVNHDSVPDLVTITCELAKANRRTFSFAQASVIVAALGREVDAEGWML